MPINSPASKPQGFTLIEVIIGVVVIAIVTLVVTSGMGPLNRQTIDPWHQVRATELANSLMSEINARRFDENSPAGVSGLRCGETDGPACTNLVASCSGGLPNAEESTRSEFDDIDDYHCLTLTGDQITNSQDTALVGVYRNFTVAVRVSYVTVDEIKRIEVAVTPPDQTPIVFNQWRGNW